VAPRGRHPWTAAVSARWPRPLVATVDAVNRRGKAVGVRLVKYTGKSRHLIHPKHPPLDPSQAPGERTVARLVR